MRKWTAFAALLWVTLVSVASILGANNDKRILDNDSFVKFLRGSWTIEYYDENGVVDGSVKGSVLEFMNDGKIKHQEPDQVSFGTATVGKIDAGLCELDIAYDDSEGVIWKCLAKSQDGKLWLSMFTDPAKNRPDDFLKKLDKNGTVIVLHRGR